jgi:DNA-binding response OmpR family regulator
MAEPFDDDIADLLADTGVEKMKEAQDKGGEKPLILVVDDETNYLELLEFNLLERGYQVETAVDGKSALERIARRKPDCILLDGLLPGIHGFEVCRQIKAGPETRDIPVIIMTAVYRKLRYKYEVKGEYGADDFITKPFEIEDIVQRIEGLLRKGRELGQAQ